MKPVRQSAFTGRSPWQQAIVHLADIQALE
jgi:hypothetical protein